jgi:hypothetical protein
MKLNEVYEDEVGACEMVVDEQVEVGETVVVKLFESLV